MGTLMWLIPTLVYIVGWTFGFRRIAGQLAWHFRSDSYYGTYRDLNMPSGKHWFWAIAIGAVLALFWPLSVPVAYGLEDARKGGNFFYCPRDQRAKIQERRIKELERAAGIDVF